MITKKILFLGATLALLMFYQICYASDEQLLQLEEQATIHANTHQQQRYEIIQNVAHRTQGHQLALQVQKEKHNEEIEKVKKLALSAQTTYTEARRRMERLCAIAVDISNLNPMNCPISH